MAWSSHLIVVSGLVRHARRVVLGVPGRELRDVSELAAGDAGDLPPGRAGRHGVDQGRREQDGKMEGRRGVGVVLVLVEEERLRAQELGQAHDGLHGRLARGPGGHDAVDALLESVGARIFYRFHELLRDRSARHELDVVRQVLRRPLHHLDLGEAGIGDPGSPPPGSGRWPP